MASPTPAPSAPKPPPSPHNDPGAWLLSKDWKCLGNPEWASALWLDPTKPLVSYYSEEPCMYDVEVREELVEDNKIKVKYRTEPRQVLAKDGRGGPEVAARRSVFHPAVTPLTLSQALMVQLDRDARVSIQQDKERKK